MYVMSMLYVYNTYNVCILCVYYVCSVYIRCKGDRSPADRRPAAGGTLET